VTGGVNFSNGVFTVGGSGDDIWNAADAFRFVYLPVSGNCTITARVLGVQNTDGWAKAGVMIRASLTTNAANAFIAVTPGNGVTWQTRSSTGGNSGNTAVGNLSAPYWVRLVRSGNTFTGYRSTNGVNWTQQGTATITMAATVYVGLALTSHNNSSLCTATFDNVTMPGWSNWVLPPAPGGLAGSADNGQAALTWQASSTAGSYNVKRSTTSGGPYAIISNVTTTNSTDVGLTNGATYYYVVSALNPAGESANSAQAALTPRPPMSLSLMGTNLALSWPLASADFRVQSCTNLVSSGWTDVTSPAPQIVGDQWQVVLPASISSAFTFYRLVK
jgi:regulation of enolase protein 1 (concanavalin A-like superfamily)